MNYLKNCAVFSILGIAVGFLIGFVLNNGDNYYTKKSQRVPVSTEFLMTCGLVGGIIGLGIGVFIVARGDNRIAEEKVSNSELDLRNWKITRSI